MVISDRCSRALQQLRELESGNAAGLAGTWADHRQSDQRSTRGVMVPTTPKSGAVQRVVIHEQRADMGASRDRNLGSSERAFAPRKVASLAVRARLPLRRPPSVPSRP